MCIPQSKIQHIGQNNESYDKDQDAENGLHQFILDTIFEVSKINRQSENFDEEYKALKEAFLSNNRDKIEKYINDQNITKQEIKDRIHARHNECVANIHNNFAKQELHYEKKKNDNEDKHSKFKEILNETLDLMEDYQQHVTQLGRYNIHTAELTTQKINEIFQIANSNGYFTNPNFLGKTDTENKFSIAFQMIAKEKGVNFSEQHKNGLRTHRATKYVGDKTNFKSAIKLRLIFMH